MTEYDNRNTGALFKNEDRASDKHPEYNGSLNIDGVEYWLSAWVRTSKKSGKKFFSMAIKPKVEKQNGPRKPLKEEMEDEIPF